MKKDGKLSQIHIQLTVATIFLVGNGRTAADRHRHTEHSSSEYYCTGHSSTTRYAQPQLSIEQPSRTIKASLLIAYNIAAFLASKEKFALSRSFQTQLLTDYPLDYIMYRPVKIRKPISIFSERVLN